MGVPKCSNIIDEMRFYFDSSAMWLYKAVGYNSPLWNNEMSNENKFWKRQKYMLNGLTGFLLEASYLLTDSDTVCYFERSCNERNRILKEEDFDCRNSEVTTQAAGTVSGYY